VLHRPLLMARLLAFSLRVVLLHRLCLAVVVAAPVVKGTAMAVGVAISWFVDQARTSGGRCR
jgi:hypothetical protein